MNHSRLDWGHHSLWKNFLSRHCCMLPSTPESTLDFHSNLHPNSTCRWYLNDHEGIQWVEFPFIVSTAELTSWGFLVLSSLFIFLFQVILSLMCFLGPSVVMACLVSFILKDHTFFKVASSIFIGVVLQLLLPIIWMKMLQYPPIQDLYDLIPFWWWAFWLIVQRLVGKWFMPLKQAILRSVFRLQALPCFYRAWTTINIWLSAILDVQCVYS